MDNESANIKRKRDMISPELPVGKRALLFDKESDPLDDTAGGDISLGEDLSDPLLALESSLLAMERIINKRKGERLSAKYFGPLTNLIANGKSAIATIKEGLVDRVQTALQPWIVDLVRRELSEAKSQTKTDAGMQPSVSYAQVVAIGSTGSRQLPGAKVSEPAPGGSNEPNEAAADESVAPPVEGRQWKKAVSTSTACPGQEAPFTKKGLCSAPRGGTDC
uniref:Uncharacterized protein n=1 Tax=Cacopsylla melanoneura TaxID=428564 RepID=A0A8D8QH41_9HEMI